MATQSLLATVRSFVDIVEYKQTIEDIHHKAQGAVIRDLISRTITVGATVAHSSEVEIYRIGTPNISHISIRVSLAGLFRQQFRFQMGVSLVVVTTVGKAVICL